MSSSDQQARARKKKSVHSFNHHGTSLSVFLVLPLSSSSIFIHPLTLPTFLTPLDAPKPPTEDRFMMPDEFATPEAQEPGRAKRSPIDSNKVGGLNVETLVVADRKMLEKHGRDNVTTYVLTVMNMVRRIFHFLGPAEQGCCMAELDWCITMNYYGDTLVPLNLHLLSPIYQSHWNVCGFACRHRGTKRRNYNFINGRYQRMIQRVLINLAAKNNLH